jgi:hypothetical protein
MSHIVTIQARVRDPAAIELACQRLGLPPPRQGSAQLFGEMAEGTIVELPGWQYPVVCDIASGSLKFDNYGGVWGDAGEIERFLQAYSCEKAKIEARRQGHTVTEQPLADGSIKLTIQMAGGAAR